MTLNEETTKEEFWEILILESTDIIRVKPQIVLHILFILTPIFWLIKQNTEPFDYN